jgi:hypothetical protein
MKADESKLDGRMLAVVIIIIVVIIVVVVVVVVVVVARWEIPGFDCCCLDILSNNPMCPHIWLQRQAMSSQIISHCHLYLVIIYFSLLYVYPYTVPPTPYPPE